MAHPANTVCSVGVRDGVRSGGHTALASSSGRSSGVDFPAAWLLRVRTAPQQRGAEDAMKAVEGFQPSKQRPRLRGSAWQE